MDGAVAPDAGRRRSSGRRSSTGRGPAPCSSFFRRIGRSAVNARSRWPSNPSTLAFGWIFGAQDVDVVDKETWGKIDAGFAMEDSGAWKDLKFGVRYVKHDRTSDNAIAQGPTFSCNPVTPTCPAGGGTDPDARLCRKGPGKEAKLSYMGQALMENRHGLLVDFQITTATGTAERDVVPRLIEEARLRGFHPKTLGADKGYDTRDCVAQLRAKRVTPHVAQNTTKGRRSAIDGRTTGRSGYPISQRKRKCIEIV